MLKKTPPNHHSNNVQNLQAQKHNGWHEILKHRNIKRDVLRRHPKYLQDLLGRNSIRLGQSSMSPTRLIEKSLRNFHYASNSFYLCTCLICLIWSYLNNFSAIISKIEPENLNFSVFLQLMQVIHSFVCFFRVHVFQMVCNPLKVQ